LGLGKGRRFADRPTQKTESAQWPEPMAKPGRCDEASAACTTPALNPGGFEQTDTPRTTAKAQKNRVVQTEAFPSAPPQPNIAVDPAARCDFAFDSICLTTPFSRLRGTSQNEHGKRPRGSAGTAG